ncbi:protein PLANT CADMIUM RESISTANCE 8 [Amborella trichopoda]|uniref:protein PLANT CADMIUM RESISTANCE 8 n=1 Tax=Amborella trichopoda TaxID=13333 RepID=UPI0005D36AAF|nr:protein PLANT CADMIUM RESISTANCE 8 [Amborella trichopoda]|eukprot:XP_006833356.2 protein PLANT CADMIUM RESISTANCE 8 [Amborella trichopoda]
MGQVRLQDSGQSPMPQNSDNPSSDEPTPPPSQAIVVYDQPPPPVPFPPPVRFPVKNHDSDQFSGSVSGTMAPTGTGEHRPQDNEVQEIGNPWTTGLFDCEDHPTSALVTAFCPCVTFGQITEVLDSGETTCAMNCPLYALLSVAMCNHWIMATIYRKKLRKKYNLVEAPTEDWIAHCCCPCCALCQEFRELNNRGLDPSLGWKGILAEQKQKQQRQQVQTNPPKDQSMSN